VITGDNQLPPLQHTLNVPCSINDNVERVTCYTYSTRGMFDAVGQKELVLTVKTSENSSGYPASPIEFFAYLYEQAKNGNKFDEGILQRIIVLT